MKARLLLVAMLAACYGPTPPAGAPCAPAAAGSRCPSGLTCVVQGGQELCLVGDAPADAKATTDDAPPDGQLTDAAIDAPKGNGDADGDGVRDVDDNCPTIANADQGNEDGDAWGDACDLCPPLAESARVDTDGDGVGDACDPNPTTAGDALVLFEGFHHGLPQAWAMTGTWTADADSVVVTSATDLVSVLNVPAPGLGLHYALSTAATATAILGTGWRSMGLVLDDGGSSRAMACGALIDNGTSNSFVALFRPNITSHIADAPLTWSVGQRLVFEQQKLAAPTYQCRMVDPVGNLTVINGAYDLLARPIGLRTRSVSARYDWVMLISSP
jgi:hypothetical protein